MSIAKHHAEWLSLLEISGPFLSMPVLMGTFPQGLDAGDPAAAQELRPDMVAKDPGDELVARLLERIIKDNIPISAWVDASGYLVMTTGSESMKFIYDHDGVKYRTCLRCFGKSPWSYRDNCDCR